MSLLSFSARMGLSAIVVLCVFSVPSAATAQEDESPWSLYISALQAAVNASISTCLEDAKELCESERDYCLMSVEEKIQYSLQVCFEEKLACGTSCQTAFEECVDLGAPQTECSAQRTLCDAACEEEGTQCTLDAINGDYEQLSAEECDNAYMKCTDYWYSRCVTTDVSPIE